MREQRDLQATVYIVIHKEGVRVYGLVWVHVIFTGIAHGLISPIREFLLAPLIGAHLVNVFLIGRVACS